MQKERGTTMIEMIGVLGVLGVLAASVYHLIDTALSQYRISQGLVQITSLQKNISRFYASAGNYNELEKDGIVAKLIADNVVPQNMKNGDAAIRHIFGGDVELKNIKYQNEISSSSTSFSIAFKELNKKECAEMAALSWPEKDSANLLSITVVGTGFSADQGKKFTWPIYASSSDNTQALPITNGMAMEVCQSEAEKSMSARADIIWEFR